MGRTIYSDYFGISENAFSITPDPRFLFMSERHCEALAHLRYGVTESGCFILLTGEVGTGKTTVCRTLLEQLPENVDVALLLSPPRTWQELLLSIADELHIAVEQRHASQHELVSILTQRLIENYGQGRRTVVIIDEAQNIPHDVLEHVRLLTNLETHTDKLLHVILVGQPELRELLLLPSLRQVAQRITARYHLDPLSDTETRAYVSHRLRVVGYQQGLFTKGALRKIYRESKGIPRVINILCDRALLGAYANDKSQVTSKQIQHAARQWRGDQPKAPFWHRYRIAVAFTVAVLVSTTAVFFGYADQWQKVVMAAGQKNPHLSAPSVPNFTEQTHKKKTSKIDPAANSLPKTPATPENASIQNAPQSEEVDKSTTLIASGSSTTKLKEAVLPTPDTEESNVVANKAEPIPVGIRSIGPGSPPQAVRWLRGELDRIEGNATNDNSPLFDDALRERVMKLQRRNGLPADGIAGPITLNYMHVIYGTSVPFQAAPSWNSSRSRV